jgi:hypothetical protein
MLSSAMLATSDTAVATVGQIRVKPFEYFMPTDQPTSNSPATSRTSQFVS